LAEIKQWGAAGKQRRIDILKMSARRRQEYEGANEPATIKRIA
jgi:hypothetical protein